MAHLYSTETPSVELFNTISQMANEHYQNINMMNEGAHPSYGEQPVNAVRIRIVEMVQYLFKYLDSRQILDILTSYSHF